MSHFQSGASASQSPKANFCLEAELTGLPVRHSILKSLKTIVQRDRCPPLSPRLGGDLALRNFFQVGNNMFQRARTNKGRSAIKARLLANGLCRVN